MKIRFYFLLIIVIAINLLGANAFCLNQKEYYNKVLGAWNGKCIGGGLGMPVEGWVWANIMKKYPNVDTYVGYIGESQVGWTNFLVEAEIPKTGNWETVKFEVTVPDFDTKSGFLSPIVGLSLEGYFNSQDYEIKNARIITPEINLSNENFYAFIGGWMGDDGIARFHYSPGERAWLKMRYFNKLGIDLKPNDKFALELDAKWVSGDNKLNLSFDILDRNAKGFGPDDDTSYQIVGLLGVEQFGADITPNQIGDLWVKYIGIDLPNYLAEGIALERLRQGINPPESGNHPVGEAIGGQMKGEIWGLLCPGRPDLAAEYAYRDGIVAHRDNGVYGEIFVSTMISHAFVETDVRKIIEKSLDYIPKDCKYAQIVRGVLSDFDSGKSWRQILKEVKEEYPSMCDPVYPEAAIITIALMEGKGDFENTIKYAFYCGSDTDCNTATVGAVIGTIIGFDNIPKKWSDPIGNVFKCFAMGNENWKITELAEKICKNGNKVMKFHGKSNNFSEIYYKK